MIGFELLNWNRIFLCNAQHTVIKTPAHRSIQQFGFQLTIEKLNLLFFRAD